MKRWRRLCIEIGISAFGYRGELNFVPFQWAKPQIGFGAAFMREKRMASFKCGPFHYWTMETDYWEISLGFNHSASFHNHVFEVVYPGSFVWPNYKKMKDKKSFISHDKRSTTQPKSFSE
jgi:hypothetical protein